MKIKVIATGQTTEKYLLEGIHVYLKRLHPMLTMHYEEIAAGKQPKKANTEVVKKQEAASQLKKLHAGDFLILLDESGKQRTSVEFSQYLQQHFNKTVQNLVFLTGGAYGFDSSVYERANETMALSSMTFTHQMARLIFMEQLYRAMSILKGLPYHHI